MAIPLDIRKSDEFAPSWGKASFELGDKGLEFDEKLSAAVKKLWQEHPGLGQPSESSEHSIVIMGSYELVYEWVTDRNMKGEAVMNHLDLLIIRHKR